MKRNKILLIGWIFVAITLLILTMVNRYFTIAGTFFILTGFFYIQEKAALKPMDEKRINTHNNLKWKFQQEGNLYAYQQVMHILWIVALIITAIAMIFAVGSAIYILFRG